VETELVHFKRVAKETPGLKITGDIYLFHFDKEVSALSSKIIQRESYYVYSMFKDYISFGSLNNIIVFTNSLGDLILRGAMLYDDFPS